MKLSKKYVALCCSAVLTALSLCSHSGIGTLDSVTAANLEEAKNLQDTLEEYADVTERIGHSDTAGKEETVYAILDADGQLQQTIVSEWLKNPEESTNRKDFTKLSDITVVKGTADYKQEKEDGNITWINDGSDIYYQGISQEALPVDVAVSYTLDGKAVRADQLKNASGHLKIAFSYTNHLSKNVTINGKKETIYQPFLMLSGLVLDNSKAENITIENGTTVNSGDHTVAFGIAMPGLSESLGLDPSATDDALDLTIPEEVILEADVHDFSLLMTLTLASNTALSQLGLDDISSVDQLKEDIGKLTDGMDTIADGTSQLHSGIGELQKGLLSLFDGTHSLSSGTKELSLGAHQLATGSAQLDAGAAELKNGLDRSMDSLPQLSSKVDTMTQGSDKLSSGLYALTLKNEVLNSGVTQLAQGIGSLDQALRNEESKEALQTLVTGSSAFSEGLSKTSDGLSKLTAGYAYDQGDLATLIDALTQYGTTLAQGEDPTDAAYGESILSMVSTYKNLYDSVASAQSGVSELSDSYKAIQGGIQKTADSITDASQGTESLYEGVLSLQDGIAAYTTGVTNSYDGMSSLNNGLHKLQDNIPALTEGMNQLSDGASTLLAGTSSLHKGASSLAAGVDKADNGTSELSTGVSQLLSGVNALTDGSKSLKDGVLTFQQEGIQKLYDIVNQDLDTYYQRLQALKDFAEEYTSYAGCPDGVTSHVKFIYKTGEI